MRNPLILLLFIFCFLPKISFGAGISISEIMYDAEGSDGGREWIEVYNSSGSDIDLTSYKFFENGVSHGISHLEGDALLANNSYAIIADNANNFTSEYTGASKSQIYDASFSLSNSAGEYLAIKNSEGEAISEITYDPSIGAAGDGNSLQKNNSGSWAASLPTVLAGFAVSNNQNNNEQNIITQNTNNNSTSSSSNTSTKKETVMHFEFSTPKTIIVGNNNVFKATLYGDNGELINYGEFVWNFGDGTIETVKNLNEISHVYLYAGDYTITCSYKYTWNPKPILVGHTNVLAIDSPFELIKFYDNPKPAIGIINNRDTEYDISKYIIKTNIGNILIPDGTFIGGKDEIVLVLPTGTYDKNSIALLNPLSSTISSFSPEIKPIEKINTNYIPISVSAVKPISNYTEEPIINTPRVITIENLEANAGRAKNNSKTPFIFIGMILLGAVCIFYVRNYRKSSESVDPDDYTLQDE